MSGGALPEHVKEREAGAVPGARSGSGILTSMENKGERQTNTLWNGFQCFKNHHTQHLTEYSD